MNTYPNWPDYALDPPPFNDDLAETFPNLVIRTDWEQGAARQRRVFASGPSTFSTTWFWTPDEYVFFKGWFNGVIASGEGWFNLSVFDGNAYNTRLVRFVLGPVKVGRDGGEWKFSGTIETMDNTSPTQTDWAVSALTWPPASGVVLDDLVDGFHTAVAQLVTDLASISS
jgi:hypothetical protein